MIHSILLADNQAITQAGLLHLLTQVCEVLPSTIEVGSTKKELTKLLLRHPQAIVIFDYSLSEMNSSEELLIYMQRFPEARWLLFSEELSEEFLRRILPVTSQVGVVLKQDSHEEIVIALQYTLRGSRYICSQVSNLLLSPRATATPKPAAQDILTPTERAILKEIALGKTTKEIAATRNLSFHTVNSHRKNIFRKIEVNNVHEAIKYAMRAGIVDLAEYYI